MTIEQTQQQLSPSFIYPPSILAGISVVAYHFPSLPSRLGNSIQVFLACFTLIQ